MKHGQLLVGLALILVSSGCAITDFDGFAEHQTASESKLWGQEIAFIAGDPELDGTYAYNVKYNNHGGRDSNMKILSYRNPVVSSFSRDGQIDRDGDDVQGRSGVLGGKFAIRYVSVDPLPGCQFFDNVTQSHGPEPIIALCATTNEEVDKDLELQASFSSLDDLFGQIWSGALNNGFTLEVTGLTLGGVNVPLSTPFSIGAKANGLRPTQLTIDVTQPGGAGLIQAILDNTSDGTPVSVGLQFAGGLHFNLPSQYTAAFNHDALWNLL